MVNISFPLSQYNLVPVFVDSDLMTLNIDTNKIEEAITPKTRAIMVVHIYGNPCKMDEIVKIAKRNLILIEDRESWVLFIKGKLSVVLESLVRLVFIFHTI